MSIVVELGHGGMEAVVTVLGEIGDLSDCCRQILDELAKLKVTVLPTAEHVRKALEAGTPQAGVVVAQATAAQPGVGAQIEMVVPTRDTPLDGGASPFETYPENVVYPGDVILRKTPASEGIPGHNLLGAAIQAPRGTDVPVIAGEGISTDANGVEFHSARYGVALFSRGTLRVADAVKITGDLMEATVTVLPDARHEESAQVDKITTALASHGIRQGIDRDALLQAVRDARGTAKCAGPVVAARGRPAVDGTETDYHIVLDLEKKAFTVKEGEHADFREIDSVKNVKQGEVLADVIPARHPVPGFRLDGSVLQPKLQRAQGLKPGDHTKVSEDGTAVVADADGMVVVKGGKFNIVDEYNVPEDVDFSTGNIRATGTVKIRGQIQSGFLVQAGKGVEVGGDVWEATVETKGDVVVRGAITSGSKVSGRNITARFISNSHVEAEGDVDVNLSIMGSQIYARGRLTVLGSQGVIIGGEVNAAKGVEAKEIGSPNARTKILVGKDVRVTREIAEILKSRAAIADGLKGLVGSLSKEFLRDPRGALLALPPALRKSKIDVLQKMKALQQQDQALAERHKELSELSIEELGAQVIVHGEIHAGTFVVIGPARTTISETISRAVLHYDPETASVTWRRM